MRYGKCQICKRIRELMQGTKVCVLCVEGIKKSFIYTIDGQKLTKKKYDTILKRGYYIPEELESIRNEDRD